MTAVTDDAGTVKERYSYTPYGEVTFLDASFVKRSPHESDIDNEYLYTGRRLDPETGLQLNRNRFYHSGLGRWVSRDPIEYEGSPWNLYEYVESDPLSFVDPTGKIIPGDPDPSDEIAIFLVCRWVCKRVLLPCGKWTIKKVKKCFRKKKPKKKQKDRKPKIEPLEPRIPQQDAPLDPCDLGDPGGPHGPDPPVVPGPINPGWNCFLSGTLVATEKGLKEIQTIDVGTRVWSYDHTNNNWILNRVIKCHENMHRGTVTKITGRDFSVTATEAHRFWVLEGENLTQRAETSQVFSMDYQKETKGYWVQARNLRKGDVLLTRSNRKLAIQNVEDVPIQEKVYNLSIEDIHNYSVQEDGVLVHNVKP